MSWAERPRLRLLLTLLGCLTALPLSASGVARVVAVVDGDTLVLERAGQRATVDLAGVDAPELDQPDGPQARRALGDRLLGHLVQVRETDSGTILTTDRESVAAALVRDGHAWVTPGPLQRELAPLEREARSSHAGLWRGSAAIAPWDWRAGVRTLQTPALRPAGMVVGDRGKQRYYPAGCSAAGAVARADRVLFRDVAAARAAGFRPAAACRGAVSR